MKFNAQIKNPKTTILIGVLIICISFIGLFQNTDINQSQLIEISGTLEKKPFLKHSQIRGANYYDFNFNLKEYESTFKISDWEYRSLDLNTIENEIKPGDTISLYILAKDKHLVNFTIENVQTYGISERERKMYDLDARNKHYKNDKWNLLLFIGIGINICLYPLLKNIYVAIGISITYAFMFILYLFLFIMP